MGRSQALPPEVLAATHYELLPGARNVSRAGTKRARRWPTILKYDGVSDGVALAHRDAGVTKRHLWLLARRAQIKLLGPDASGRPRINVPRFPEYSEDIAYITSLSAKEAFRYMVARESCPPGYSLKRVLKGRIKAFGYYRAGTDDKPFAFIVNKGSLLFYLRHRHKTHPDLKIGQLATMFPEGNAAQKKNGEFAFSIFSVADAKRAMELAFRDGPPPSPGNEQAEAAAEAKQGAAPADSATARPTIAKKARVLTANLSDDKGGAEELGQSQRGAGFGDAVENKLVEDAAIRAVTKFYETNGWNVRSVERDKCGFDLHCCRDPDVEYVEVKGVRGTEQCFIITAGEVNHARTSDNFVLVVVTSALSTSPALTPYAGPEIDRNFELSPVQFRATLRKPRSGSSDCQRKA